LLSDYSDLRDILNLVKHGTFLETRRGRKVR
jgi:hypothetical protein